jgi:hypothetical protein
MKILYLTDGINAVFQSQVLGLMNEVAKNESISKVVLCIGLRDLSQIPKFKLTHPKIELLFFKSYPMYPFFNILTKRSIIKTFKNITDIKNYIIHVRIEFLASLIYDELKKDSANAPKFLVDIRGALIEEIKEYGKYNVLLKTLKLFMYKKKITRLLNQAPTINVVSKALKDYIKSKYSVQHNRISIIPTIAGNNFSYKPKEGNLVRKSLGISDNERLYVFSSGSSQTWQNTDELINVAETQNIKILLLTKDNIKHPNIISKYVDYEAVPNYLAAADVGVIIRENSIVNYVSSPIKFCEYVSSGLPVQCVGDIKTISDFKSTCNSKEMVQISDEFLFDTSISFTSIQRKELSAQATKTFGVKAISLRYIDEYKNLNS